jgi:hypothetical protein
VVANEQVKPDAARMAAPVTQLETMLLEMGCAARPAPVGQR